MAGETPAAPSPAGPASLSAVALRGRCPRCGRGPLFSGLLTVRERCPVCGLDLRAQDAGDGPAVFAILLVGAVAVIAAIILEVRAAPPLWVHAALWPLLVLPLSVWVMRVAKAALIAQQWRLRRDTVER